MTMDNTTCKSEPPRGCSCHPDDRPLPCPRRHASHECWREAVLQETNGELIALKNRDRSPSEELLLNYLKRVRRSLEFA